ncbi:purine-cytosine permease family protein [Mycolicibacterium palauense]|uniref:purine-cytosine permease family protein n=1 Tax=Mycolicibacterium palauense TaxID=2034511 RepID=UPI000BFF0C03|nr:cytosine permease [Mycolicibacterium palauense]
MEATTSAQTVKQRRARFDADHGIAIIPEDARRMRPRDLAYIWTGGLCNVQTVVFGALVGLTGLSLWQSIVAIIIANFTWCIAAMTSFAGNASGTTAFVTSRAPFGYRGGRIASFFNWLSQLVFETSGLYMVVVAVLALLDSWGMSKSMVVTVAVVISVIIIQGVLPRLGHGAIQKAMRLLVIPAIVFFSILAVLTLGKIQPGSVPDADLPLFVTGLAVAMSVSGVSWMANASDYSRYLPTNTTHGSHMRAMLVGAAIPMTILMILGAAVSTISADSADPISGLPQTFSSWFFVPYLIFGILQLLAINSLDLYSSGVTLQALGAPLSRVQAVMLDLIICGVVVVVALFSSDFYSFVTTMLLFVMVWLGPWGAIQIADYWLRRGRYDTDGFFAGRDGIYWRDNGFHTPAFVALIAGAVTAVLTISTPIFTGPISSGLLADADISIIASMIVSSAIYVLWAGKAVRAEAASI